MSSFRQQQSCPLASLLLWAGGGGTHIWKDFPAAEGPGSISWALCAHSPLPRPSSQPVVVVLKTKCLILYGQINPAGAVPAGQGGSDKFWAVAALGFGSVHDFWAAPVWQSILLWLWTYQIGTNGSTEPKATLEMNWKQGSSWNWNVLCGFAIDPVLYKELQSTSLASNQGNGTVSLFPFEHRLEKSKTKKTYQAKQSITHTLYHSKYFSKKGYHSSAENMDSTGIPQGNQSAEHWVPLGSENKIKQ